MVSMAPIASEANPVTSCIPPHFGDIISEVLAPSPSTLTSLPPTTSPYHHASIVLSPPSSLLPSKCNMQMNSVWFKLFLYSTIGAGPTSMLIPKGTRLKVIPSLFQVFIFNFSLPLSIDHKQGVKNG